MVNCHKLPTRLHYPVRFGSLHFYIATRKMQLIAFLSGIAPRYRLRATPQFLRRSVFKPENRVDQVKSSFKTFFTDISRNPDEDWRLTLIVITYITIDMNSNLAGVLKFVQSSSIRTRVLDVLSRASPDLSSQVSAALWICLNIAEWLFWVFWDSH